MQNSIIISLQPDELKEIIKDSLLEVLESSNLSTQPEKEDTLINFKEACKLLGISSVTLHKWKKQRIIPFYRMNKKIYFKKDELFESLKKVKQV